MPSSLLLRRMTMMLAVCATARRCFFAQASDKIYRTVQAQVVHRHGDRSPITPLKDEEFWAGTLISSPLLEKISEGTTLLQQGKKHSFNEHKAGGRGPFGKLSELGLLQMIQVGETLREYFDSTEERIAAAPTKNDGTIPEVGKIFTPKRPLHPRNLRVVSTNFPRTVQSVQGLLVGLFPDGIQKSSSTAEEDDDAVIPIDVRHTEWMIPDPQPRRSAEQEQLELQLSRTPHVLDRERELLPLALRTTKALHDLLAPDAHEAAFGVEAPEDQHPEHVSIEIEPLAWVQLAEITKCLSVRDMLPAEISPQDVQDISKHAAWRWFQSLSHPRLIYLAMNKMATQQLDYFANHENEPPMTIWSAHDSTLIGLMCAYRLEQPAVWPEYASYMLLELIQGVEEGSNSKPELFVRFSLNGQVLKSHWEDDDKPREMIPLELLRHRIRTVGAKPTAVTD